MEETPEDPLVAEVEAALSERATFRPVHARGADRPRTPAVVWLCACVGDDDAAAPTWLVWVEGDQAAWGWLPDGWELSKAVTASAATGAHVDPEEVLGWLRGGSSLPHDQVDPALVRAVESALDHF